MSKIEIQTLNDLKDINFLDISKTYIVNHITVRFDPRQWEWLAVNIFGFGVDSDISLELLLRRLL